MKRILLVLLAALMLFMTACDIEGDAAKQPEQTSNAFLHSDDDVFAVETPYCVLKYPVKWEKSVVTDITATETLFEVAYSAIFDTVQIPLFTICVGEDHDGFELGFIETDDGLKTVYMDDFTDEYDGTLSPKDEALYMEMCEDVNVIISSLVYECGMQLP